MSAHQSAQPPHNNRPDNQADWLDEVLENGLYLESYVYDALPGGQQVTGKVVRLKPQAKAAITTKIAEERIKELTLLKTKKVKGANLVELKWVDGRIAELEALKGDK